MNFPKKFEWRALQYLLTLSSFGQDTGWRAFKSSKPRVPISREVVREVYYVENWDFIWVWNRSKFVWRSASRPIHSSEWDHNHQQKHDPPHISVASARSPTLDSGGELKFVGCGVGWLPPCTCMSRNDFLWNPSMRPPVYKKFQGRPVHVYSSSTRLVSTDRHMTFMLEKRSFLGHERLGSTRRISWTTGQLEDANWSRILPSHLRQ